MTSPFTRPTDTPAVQRLFAHAAQFANDGQLPAWFLLTVLEDESLGGEMLRNAGLTSERVRAAMPELLDEPVPATDEAAPLPDWLTKIFDRARLLARHDPEESSLTSIHLARALIETDSPVRELLNATGIRFETAPNQTVQPLTVNFNLKAEETLAVTATDESSANILTLIDANLNRAREGMRVLEDYARFAIHVQSTATQLKQMRHRLVEAEYQLIQQGQSLLGARDVARDQGTSVTTAGEQNREGLQSLLTANSRRVQESLRSLEEFGKLISPGFSAIMKQLRYQAYDVEQQLSHTSPEICNDRSQQLGNAQVYILLTESLCALPWKQTLDQILSADADIVQLREKHLSHTELERRARYFADACRNADVLSIINDNSGVAAKCDADGVHIGQDDESPESARAAIGPDRLLGISTHNSEQLVTAGRFADYVGVGPVFSTSTKTFAEYAGLEFVQTASSTATVPWFAIGGINSENLKQLCESGASRVAVSGAVIGTETPGESVARLKSALAPHASKASVS